MKNDHNLTRLMRWFLLLTALVLCIAGTAVGVTALHEKSRQSENAQRPMQAEDIPNLFTGNR